LIYFFLYLSTLKINNLEHNQANFEKNEISYKKIFSLGIFSIIASLANVVLSNSDNLIISRFSNVSYLISYSITFRLFTIIFQFIFLLNSSLVPLIGKLNGDKDFSQINRMFKNATYLIFYVSSIIWLVTFLLLRYIITLLVGEFGFPGYISLFLFGFYSYVISINNLNAVFTNTLNYLKESIFIYWIEVIVKLFVSFLIINYFSTFGVLIGSITGAILGPLIFFPLLIKKKSKSLIHFDYLGLLVNFFLLLPFLITIYFINSFSFNFFIQLSIGSLIIIIFSLIFFIILPKETRNFYLLQSSHLLLRFKK
jgi:O-antigen/teichoic acid export membrane protein